MIITKTPFRVSFFGGGTDVQQFFNKHGGSVISTSIDKYCYVNVRRLPPFFGFTSELSYSKTERVISIDEIEHPAIRNAMKMMDIHDIRLVYDSDLPARSGLGTSSSFSVGMLNAFYTLKGQPIDRKRLASDAIYLERSLCEEFGGWQDQVVAAYGGFNRIDFLENEFFVKPIAIQLERKEELNNNLMMFFTGFTRLSSVIQEEFCKSIDQKNRYLYDMLESVDIAQEILTNSTRDLDELGKLLDYTWNIKRHLNHAISNKKIDEIYAIAKNAGAIGGKLLGAGGGGFFLFYVPQKKQRDVKEALNELMYIPFKFIDEGSQIVYYNSEVYSSHLCREK